MGVSGMDIVAFAEHGFQDTIEIIGYKKSHGMWRAIDMLGQICEGLGGKAP